MNILLINPLFCSGEYIPQGLLLLKDYVHRQPDGKDFNVEVLDINKIALPAGFRRLKDEPLCASCYNQKNRSDCLVQRHGFKFGDCYEYRHSKIRIHAYERITKNILKRKPDVVGFSVFNTFVTGIKLWQEQLSFSLLLAEKLKKNAPGIKVILGGAAFYSDDQNLELMRCFPFLDVIVKGQGEMPFNLLLTKIKNGESDFQNIPNIAWRQGDVILKNTKSVPIHYPHSIPDYSQINLQLYQRNNGGIILPVRLSNGCYWANCKFCVSSCYSKYMVKPKEHIKKEMEYYIRKLNKRLFFLCDEAVHPELFGVFADMIIKHKWKISYAALAIPGEQFSKKLLKKIADSGCKIIMWGAESFSDRLLKNMQKGTDSKSIGQVLTNAYHAGIFNTVFYIFGLPFQNKDDLMCDCRFLEEHIKYIANLRYSFFRLDRESRYYKEIYKKRKDLLIPFYTKLNSRVHCLCCRFDFDNPLYEMFKRTILKFAAKNTTDTNEHELLYIVSKNKRVTPQTLDKYRSVLPLLNTFHRQAA